MAAIVSSELLQYISPVLVWIFVFAILYVLLQKIDLFKGNQPMSAAIAFAASILFVVVPVMRELVQEVVPWLLVMILVIVVILIILMFMGYKEVDIVKYMQENSFGATISIIVVILFLVILGKVIGPGFYQHPGPAEVGLAANFRRVLFNPKTLGMIFILVVAFYFIKVISIPIKVLKK